MGHPELLLQGVLLMLLLLKLALLRCFPHRSHHPPCESLGRLVPLWTQATVVAVRATPGLRSVAVCASDPKARGMAGATTTFVSLVAVMAVMVVVAAGVGHVVPAAA